MKRWNSTSNATKILLVATVLSLVVSMALPIVSAANGIAPAATHLQQIWSKTHAAIPAPLSNCVLPANAAGDDCYNPGTQLTWTLMLSVCSSSTTVCSGTSQETINLDHAVALLPPGETYVPGSETSATLTTNVVPTFTTGSCSSLGAPSECAALSVPSDTYLLWNFTTSPALNGHPQAQFTYSANLTASDGALLVDWAIAHYTVGVLEQNPVVSDEVFVANPVLDIQKTCPAEVPNGSAVAYDLSLINTGHQNATGVSVIDPAPAGVTFTSAAATAPLASYTAAQGSWTGTIPANSTVNVTFGADIATAATSVVNAAGYTASPPNATFLHENASCTTNVVHPEIDVAKTVDPTLVSNPTPNTINVVAHVTNTGDTTLYNISVVDSLAGKLTCPTTTLAPAASMNCTGSYVIPQGTSASFSNDSVVANGTDRYHEQVNDTDNASVQIVHPAISVVKEVLPVLVSNQTTNLIDIRANVTNVGDTTLYNVSAVDSLGGNLSCPSAPLAPGDWVVCTGSYEIPMGTSADFSNDTVVANGSDFAHNNVTATSNASVVIAHPAIAVEKVVDPTLVSNQTANTIAIVATVTNLGDTPLYNISVVDSLGGNLSCPSGTLAAGASMNCTGSYVIPKGTATDFSNDTVTASGSDFAHNLVTDEADASVRIVHPAITVVKTVDPTMVSNLAAHTIDVSALVTNTGDTTLYNVSVVDSLAGGLFCPTATLAPGESTTCTGSYVIPMGSSADYSNDTVVANGSDFAHNNVADTDHASVLIVHPAIDVVKAVDPTLVSDQTANTIEIVAEVTNTGDVTLYNVSAIDSLGGTLSCASDTLAPGASTNCTGSYVIPMGTGADYSNDTVVANGTDAFHANLTAEDNASVQIVHPAIDVVKVVDPTLVSNLTANTIDLSANVTNTGDTTLYNVSAVDSLGGTLSCPAGTLAPGDWMVCTGSYVLPQGATADYSNDTVIANGSDFAHNNVTDTDHASVLIVHPAIQVTKTVDPTVVSSLVNNTITVTVTVTNTGDTTLYNVSVIDTLAGTLSCGTNTLAAGVSTSCNGTYVIPKGTTADFSNDTAIGNGSDIFHNNVTDEDNATVVINHPTPGGVTDTEFCPLPNDTFRIIYGKPAGGLNQLKSTNPGQFYYNVYSTDGMVQGSTLTVTIPYPFVTQGAVPSQVFLNQPLPTCPSSVPDSNINGQFTISPMTFGLSAYTPENFGSTVTIAFTLNGPSIAPGNQLWFAIHLAYGLKGQMFNYLSAGSGSCPSPPNTGPCAQLAANHAVVIGNPQNYTFSNSWSGTTAISSWNDLPMGQQPATLSPVSASELSAVSVVPLLGASFMVAGLVLARRGRPADAGAGTGPEADE